jgi:PAS domain S-box-containing protein
MAQSPPADVAASRDWVRTQLIAAMVDSSDDAIIAKTLDGLITTWNRGAERMYGYSAEEIVGQSMTALCPADRADEIREILARICRNETVSHHETVRRRKDGTTFPASVTVSPIRDERGRLLGASSIARDITEQVQLRTAQELIRRAEDLKLANRNLESFTYSVSHDLRAPLRAMSGFSTALLEEYGDVLGDGRGYAERIVAASEQMATLIDSLLHLSRVARAELRLEQVDLGAEAAAVAGELQRQEPGRRVRFTIARPVPARADRSLIRTVLQNLLGNAWKFTSGREDASIEFGTAPAQAGQVCCYIRDNGAGFDAAYMDKLFTPFQRLHTDREFAGTGIGLASVRQIVERHGGEVRAEGAVGEGAAFYFTLDAGEFA